jgi:hypothetical protein
MSVFLPPAGLVCLALTPEATERLCRDLIRAEVLVGRLGGLTKDQDERDAAHTTVANLKLWVSRWERAWESQIGLGRDDG